jgi:hypothetical protein
MKNNKLIAEFMGSEWHKAWFKDVCIISPSNISYKFHSSWDWLMPVLKKAHEQMHPNSRGLWRMITHPFNYDIEDVHNQVVEFIKELNKK